MGESRGKALLAEHLDAALVCLRLGASTKDEAIGELLRLLADRGRLRDVAAAAAAVQAREAHYSTGLADGVAVPHAIYEEAAEPLTAIGLKPAGLDFASADGKSSTIIVLTLLPAGRPGLHLRWMAALSSRLQEARLRQALLTAATPEQVVALLTGRAQVGG